jgi:hypothetical protein
MRIIKCVLCVSIIGALAVACGGDDDDNDNDADQTAGAGAGGSASSHMGGADGKSSAAAGESGKNTDTGAAGSTEDGTGKDQGGSGTLVGSCDTPDFGFCTTYECIGETVCENAEVGYPRACDQLEGTWSDEACSEANALGACRDPSSSGDMIVVYAEDGLISASIAEQSCTDDGGTFTAF